MLKAFNAKRPKADDNRIGNEAFEQFVSFQVILVMFELALFNKDVIRQTKSGPIMVLQSQLYNYLEQNEERILYMA